MHLIRRKRTLQSLLLFSSTAILTFCCATFITHAEEIEVTSSTTVANSLPQTLELTLGEGR